MIIWVNALNNSQLIRQLYVRFKEIFGSEPLVVVSAPGRLDFLNTHQDYKGLPVVSVGINLRTYVAMNKSSNASRVISLNLAEIGLDYEDKFHPPDPILRPGKWFGNYLRASVKALFRLGMYVDNFNALIYSEVPIASGLASSAALLVSFITALNELFGLGLTRKQVAETAYIAEHDVMGIPCGRLDQYGSAFGGIIKIETRPPFRVERLPWLNGVFTVMDSGIRHSTADIHPVRQREINEGLHALLGMQDLPASLRDKLADRYDKVEWGKIEIKEIEPYLKRLPEIPRKRILYTILTNRTTEIALDIMRGKKVNVNDLVSVMGKEWINKIEKVIGQENEKELLIGLIMSYQHILLRDLYELSIPELEKIWKASLEAGAYGSKLSGAGLGGSIIALSSKENAEKIMKASLNAGAKMARIVFIDEGFRIEDIK